MNQKQLREIANQRAFKEYKWLSVLMLLPLFGAIVAIFLTGRAEYAVLGMAIILLRMFLLRQSSNRHLAKIIKERDAQAVTMKEIQEISADRATGGIRYWIWMQTCALPVAIAMLLPSTPWR